MSQFTIITKGIAASYIKDDAWKVLFPFDVCHCVRLRLADNDDRPTSGIPLGQMGVRINISVDGATSITAKGDGYDDFLDLTGAGVHDEVKTQFDIEDMNAVMLSMDNAVMSVHDRIAEPYRLINRDGTPPTTTFQTTGNGSISVIDGDVLHLAVSGGDTNFSMTFTSDATLVFDNDCPKLIVPADALEKPVPADEFGDMDMLYDILCDSATAGLKFMMEKDPAAVASASTVSSSSSVATNGTTSEVALALKPESPTSGLPCNMFQISKIRLLPS